MLSAGSCCAVVVADGTQRAGLVVVRPARGAVRVECVGALAHVSATPLRHAGNVVQGTRSGQGSSIRLPGILVHRVGSRTPSVASLAKVATRSYGVSGVIRGCGL